MSTVSGCPNRFFRRFDVELALECRRSAFRAVRRHGRRACNQDHEILEHRDFGDSDRTIRRTRPVKTILGHRGSFGGFLPETSTWHISIVI